MSKRKFLNTIKRRVLAGGPKLKGQIKINKVSYGSARQDWAKQLRGIETLGSGLIVMRMS